MATYDALTDRTAAGVLVPEDLTLELLKTLNNESVALQRFRQVRMSRKQKRMPVLDLLPKAYFVNGDTGLKQTTDLAWKNKFLNAEVLAVILPVPDEVNDDTEVDIFEAALPLIANEMARTIDAAALFGTNKPAAWGDAIAPTAVARAHAIARGTNAQNKGGIAQDFSDAFALVENDGYDVTGIAAVTSYKGYLRAARNTLGDKLRDVSPTEVEGVPVSYPARGLWAGAPAEAILGDWSQAILGVRTDMRAKVITEGVITDDTGKVVLNLAQQDSQAIRITFRVAYEVANTLTYDNENEASRYPFAVLTAPASS